MVSVGVVSATGVEDSSAAGCEQPLKRSRHKRKDKNFFIKTNLFIILNKVLPSKQWSLGIQFEKNLQHKYRLNDYFVKDHKVIRKVQNFYRCIRIL